jgi:hypothetical protein
MLAVIRKWAKYYLLARRDEYVMRECASCGSYLPAATMAYCEIYGWFCSEDEARVYRANAVEGKAREDRMATGDSDRIEVTVEPEPVAVAVDF